MEKKKCFFVSPIGKDGSEERKNSDMVLQYFLKPIMDEFNYEIIRSDQESDIVRIDSSVINHLKNDELVICDMTGNNPNVFYEFGYRQAIGLPLIPIIREGQKIPMDVTTLRTITYTTTDISQLDSIKKKVKDSVQAIQADKNISSKIKNESDSGISQSLLSINDKLDFISDAITKRNANDVELVAQQVAKYSKPQMSDEAALMQAVMPQLLSNPESMKNMLKLSKIIGDEDTK